MPASPATRRFQALHQIALLKHGDLIDATLDLARFRSDTARAIELLKLSTSEPAPNDDAKRKELAEITTKLAGLYGAGKYCPNDGRECMSGSQLEELIAQARDYDEALDYWVGWREVSKPMREW